MSFFARMKLLSRTQIAFYFACVCMAWTQLNIFQFDEHYQVIVFAAHKLGQVPKEQLAWEYPAHIRPFFQPALAFGILAPLQALTQLDIFAQLVVVRIVFALLFCAAYTRFVGTSTEWVEANLATAPEAQAAHERFMYTAGFIPWLAARPCSEVVSTSFFLLGFCSLSPRSPRLDARATTKMRSYLLAGAWFGAAFQTRYQSAILIVGVLAWLLWKRGVLVRMWSGLALGFSSLFALGAASDRWGYGEWRLPAYDYFVVNLVQGMANRFSRSPFTFYFAVTWTNLFFLASLVVFAALFVFWLRKPKHLATWATLPFFVVHTFLLAHKEARFLWPLGIVGAAMVVPGFYPGSSTNRWLARVWNLRRGIVGRSYVIFNALTVVALCLYPFNWKEHGLSEQGVYRALHSGDALYLDHTKSALSPLYRKNWKDYALTDECAPHSKDGAAHFLLTTAQPSRFPQAQLIHTEWLLGTHALGLRSWVESTSDLLHSYYDDSHPVRYYDLYRLSPSEDSSRALCAGVPHVIEFVRPPGAAHE
jgi:hypothetical protein